MSQPRRSLFQKLVRAIALAILRTIYRIRTHGQANVPEGGALLVSNHLSHVDALVIGAALSRREVRFLMHRSIFAIPFVGSFSKWMGAMPVSSDDSPEAKAKSLAEAAETARSGELVCIFAEGGISRSGALLPFARGLEVIAREAKVPIVPVGLDRLWGSIFSFSEGRFFWKRPKRIPYPVEVSIGAPMPFDSERWRVRAAVSELVARSREERASRTRSLAYRFLRSARSHAPRIAIAVAGEVPRSFRMFLRDALVARAVLRKRPIASGRVGIRIPSGEEAALAHVAVALAGRIAVPMDDGYDAEGLDCILDSMAEVAGEADGWDRTSASLLSFLPGPLLARMLDPVRDGRAPAALFRPATHGGRVLLSHAALASNTEALAQMFSFGPGEAVLGVLPLSSALGAVANLWVPLLSGGTVVFPRDERDPASVGEACTLSPTVVVATPSIYRSWLGSLPSSSFGGMKLAICGGAPLDRRLADAWQARFGIELCEGYGCTELAAVVSVNLPGIESRDARQNASRPGTAGRAIPGVAVRVVDPVTSEMLPPESEGLLLARGPGRMLGYEANGAAREMRDRDGWFVTGDRAVLDKDAFLTITGPGAPERRPLEEKGSSAKADGTSERDAI